MYEQFYGFQSHPFSLLPDPNFLFLGRQHKLAMSLLEYGLLNRAVFSVITGDPGTGKTTLLNAILDQSKHQVTLGVLSNTHAGLGSLMPWVLMAFDMDGKGMDSVELYRTFSTFLAREHSQHRRVVLVVDEAQNLGSAMLEELRLLSNLNDGRRQPLQIILSGQPALRDLLKRNELVQFAQRVSVDYHLQPFVEAETPSYIRHRSRVAGGDALIFTDQACLVAHRLTEGNPRLINQLCDVSLAYGFAEQSDQVTAQIVWKAARDRCAGGILPLGVRPLDEMLVQEEIQTERQHVASRVSHSSNGGETNGPAAEPAGAWYERGLAHKQAGSYRQALVAFEQAGKDALFKMRSGTQIGVCYCATGRYHEAAQTFARLLTQQQGSAQERVQIRYLLGRSLETLGRSQAALSHYRIVQKEQPDYRDVSSRLARLSSSGVIMGFPREPGPFSWFRSFTRSCSQLLRSTNGSTH